MSTTFHEDPWAFCDDVAARIQSLGYSAGVEGGGAAGPWVYTTHGPVISARPQDTITCLWGPPPEDDLPTWYASAHDAAGDVEAVTRVAETAPIDDLDEPGQVAAAIVARFADINRAVDARAVDALTAERAAGDAEEAEEAATAAIAAAVRRFTADDDSQADVVLLADLLAAIGHPVAPADLDRALRADG